MKPFITPEISASGLKVLRFQCEGIQPEDISKYLENLSLVAYSMPANHSFQAVWIFRLIFDNGASLEFSSACTMVVGWQEMGSLNVRALQTHGSEDPDTEAALMRFEVTPIRVKSVVKLTYQDTHFRSECGMAIGGENKEEILIVTGAAPGSVSVAAPFATAPFESEFPIDECNREIL